VSDNSAIEWTDATWNPATGCDEVSPGCDRCYAKTFAERWRGTPGHHFEQGFDVVLRPERLDQPLKWKKPRRVFVNSMSDLFHEAIPDEYIVEVFARMWWSPKHTFQVLTKRHGRMRSLLPRIEEPLRRRERDLALVDCPTPLTWPLPNVWLGVSVEDQKWADIRVPALLDTPAAVRWLSCEPLLGPVDLTWCAGVNALEQDWTGGPGGGSGAPHPFVDWVVVGGESGRGARPMHPDWARGIRDACIAASVPYFFKQWGNWVAPDHMPEDTFMSWDLAHGTDAIDRSAPWRVGKKAAGRLLDGRTWDEYPVRESTGDAPGEAGRG
jgi:protein gp37